MSYIAKAKDNRVNADKARAFDDLQRQQRERNVYETGAMDAYSDVERELMARAQQAEMQRQQYAPQYAMQDANNPRVNVLPTPTEPPTDNGLALAIQNRMKDNAYTNALFKAQSSGDMSEENINRLVEQELNRTRGVR